MDKIKNFNENYSTEIHRLLIAVNLVCIVIFCFAKNSYDICDKTSDPTNLKNMKNGIDTIITIQAIMIAISVMSHSDKIMTIEIIKQYIIPVQVILMIIMMLGGFATVLGSINKLKEQDKDKYNDLYNISYVIVFVYLAIVVFLISTSLASMM